MRSSKLWAALAVWLWLATPALAQFVTPASMRDANLTPATNVNFVTTLNAFSTQRTLTIPGAGGLSAYYLQFIDTANAVNGANSLRIVSADGSLINGASALVVTKPGAYLFIVPAPSGYSASVVYASSGSGNPAGGTPGQVQWNNAGSLDGLTISGDATLNTSTGVFTFGTVNANVGSFGSATQCASITVSAKGLVTAAAQNLCTPAIASVTGLGTGVATALAIPIGSAGAPILFNGAAGTPSSLVGTNITGTAAGFNIGGNAATATTANAVPVSGITGLGTGCATWLATPSSANLRGCISDETGTGLAYFQGGALGTPASGTLTFGTGLPVSTGIAGFGTGVATALAINASATGGFPLYTEGTFTPTLSTSGTQGTPVYSVQVGSYERIGRQVTARFSLVTTSWGGAPTGNVSIAGLPITSTNNANDYGICYFTSYSFAGLPALNYGVGAFVGQNSTSALWLANGNATSSLVTAAQAGTVVNLTGYCIYRT